MKEMNSVNTEIMHINSLCTNVFCFVFKNTTGKNVFFMQRSIFQISVSFAP